MSAAPIVWRSEATWLTVHAMPCIPSYQEQQEDSARLAVEVWRKALEVVVIRVMRSLPVMERLLADHEHLAQRSDAQDCLTALRSLATTRLEVTPGLQPEGLTAEALRMKELADRGESQLCFAGTLAWIAESGRDPGLRPAELNVLLARHQEHREADRRNRLSQLRGELAEVTRVHQRAPARSQGLGASADGYRDEATLDRGQLGETRDAENASYRTAKAELEDRIERINALSVDAICSNRSAF